MSQLSIQQGDGMDVVCPGCGDGATISPALAECVRCGRVLRNSLGMLDLASAEERCDERRFYDAEYQRARKAPGVKQTIASVAPKWRSPDAPECALVLEKVGNLAGKTVLLLGNGESVKELFFLTMLPGTLVYSDLSMHALINISERFDLEEHRGRLVFASVDAHHISFGAQAFDVVYGYAMVHHLPDLDRFFASVMKALKPGGQAVFMDDAFAPLWHFSKQTWLRPLMRRSHERTGISPEDYRFSMSGGFREEELEERIRRAGGEPHFARTSLLTYLFYRGAEKLLPRGMQSAMHAGPIARSIGALDRTLCRIGFLKRNQIRLVWGFRKPLDGVGQPRVGR